MQRVAYLRNSSYLVRSRLGTQQYYMLLNMARGET